MLTLEKVETKVQEYFELLEFLHKEHIDILLEFKNKKVQAMAGSNGLNELIEIDGDNSDVDNGK